MATAIFFTTLISMSATAQVTSTHPKKLATAPGQANQIQLELTSGSKKLKTQAYVLGDSEQAFAALKQGMAVQGVRSLSKQHVVLSFLQRGTLLVVLLDLKRRNTLSDGTKPRRWAKASPAPSTPLTAGTTVFLESNGQRIPCSVTAVSKSCSSQLLPVFHVRTKIRMATGGFPVVDGHGNILGFRIYENTLPNQQFQQVAVYTAALKKTARNLKGLHKRLIHGVDPKLKTALSLSLYVEQEALSANGSKSKSTKRHKTKAHAIFSSSLIFSSVSQGQQVTRISGPSPYPFFYQKGNLVVTRFCNSHRPSHLSALPTASPGTKTAPLTMGRHLFYFTGKGFWETKIVTAPGSFKDPSGLTFEVASIFGVDSSFGHLAEDALPLVDESGLLVGLRTSKRFRSINNVLRQLDGIVTVKALKKARLELQKQINAEVKLTYAQMTHWTNQLNKKLSSSLVKVRVQTTQGTTRQLWGLLVQPNVVLARRFPFSSKTTITVSSQLQGTENTVEVKKLCTRLPGTVLLLLEKPIKGLTPFPLSFRSPQKVSNKRTVFFTVAKRNVGGFQFFAFASMGGRLHLALSNEASSPPGNIVGAMPMFYLNSTGIHFRGLSRKVTLTRHSTPSPCLISPVGWNVIPLKQGLSIRSLSARRIDRISKQHRLFRTKDHWSRLRRRHYYRKRLRRGRGPHFKMQFAMEFTTGSFKLNEETNSENEVTAKKEIDVPLGVKITPRMRFFNTRLQHSRSSDSKILLFLVGMPFFNGYEAYVDFPMSADYLIPYRREGNKRWRFRGGMALSMQSRPLGNKWILPTLFNLVLPEVGFTAIHEKNKDPIWGLYFGLVRFPITYSFNETIGLRFSFTMQLGYLFPKNEEGKTQTRREVSLLTKIGLVLF